MNPALPTSNSPRTVLPSSGQPAEMEQEEASHRHANLLQIVLCNFERTVGGTARLAAGGMRDQVGAARRLQVLLDCRDSEERPVADHLRARGQALERVALRPGGHVLGIEVETGLEKLPLPARTLSALGQLVVEAVMNAAKHAFPGGPGGRVTMRLSRGGEWLSCVIADDGVGSRGTLSRIGSRGMVLTDALAERAGGRCGWVFGQQGTEVRITWPIGPGAHQTNP